MIFHLHKYEQISDPKHSHYDSCGIEVVTMLCKCRICGKTKEKKFVGHIIGQLGGD